MTKLTIAALHAILDYNPCTGEFRWSEQVHQHLPVTPNVSRCNRRPGEPVQWSPHAIGYLQVRLGFYGTFLAHRLAWFYETGRFPPKGHWLDHENRLKADNRYENLRVVTPSDNNVNCTTRPAKSGLPKGVNERGGRYRARAMDKRRQVHIGTFDTPEEAHEAYRAWTRAHHPRTADLI